MLHISPRRVSVCAVLICFVFGLGTGYAATPQEEAQRKQRIDKLRKGVVKVTAIKPRDVRDVGAGIMIGEQEGDVYFLTAYHVIEDASQILIESYGQRGKQYQATVFRGRYDPTHDLAVLTLSKYGISDSVEQLYEADLSKVQPGDETIVIGHPPDKEWELSWTPLRSKNDTRLILNRGIVQPSHSGGPLLDIYGNLIGVIIGNNETGYGEVVRIDTALAIVDKWGGRYQVKFIPDFCRIVRTAIDSSLKNFDDWKGGKTDVEKLKTVIWELNDRSLDITGMGRTKLIKSWMTNGIPAYVANFGSQRNTTEATRVWDRLSQQLANCLPPGEKLYKDGKYCWRCGKFEWEYKEKT